MEEISAVRDTERRILADVRNARGLVDLLRILSDESRSTAARNACIHSLRRIFAHNAQQGRLSAPKKAQKGSKKRTEEDPAARQFREWLYGRYTAFIGALAGLVKGEDVDLQVHAVRTLVEIAKNEHALEGVAVPALGLKTFALLIRSLVAAPGLLNDVVAMIKEEITSHADCAVAALVAITNYVDMVAQDEKESGRPSDKFNTHNAIALLMTIRPDELDFDPASYLVPSEKDVLAPGAGGVDEDEPDDEEDERKQDQQTGTRKKRKLGSAGADESDARRKKFNKIYSKAWLAVLRRPMSSQEYKTVLKWLPDHVLPVCCRPLELADFLTDSYNQGGAISLLALNGLFVLIRDHNLDYPKFFPSLYKLCQTETFLAKYRAKFFRLLHLCLKSSNLPAYAIAAFLKRMHEAALTASPSSCLFVLSLGVQLIRSNPECLSLLHRTKPTQKRFDSQEEENLEKTNALESCLWEIEALQHHYLHTVADMAESVQKSKDITTVGRHSIPIDMEQFIGQTYSALFSQEAKRKKRQGALAFQRPKTLLQPSNDLIQESFEF